MIAKLILAGIVCFTAPAWAADEHGHEHGGAAASTNSNGPTRQPDGSVFLPKPAQRQLSVRTTVAKSEELPRTVELTGKVTMDPNAGGKVQAMAPGRIEPGTQGLPTVGRVVRKGEVLAYVAPSAAPLERSVQTAQLAELRASRALAEKRLARLKELSDTIPQKEIEAAQSELASLGARAGAVDTGLSGREVLVAPVAGVIASSHIVAGQVVDARELIYEVVDPTRLSIEALSFDATLGADVGGASFAIGNERVPLKFLGAARTLREQALPMTFAAQGAILSKLAVGQPVKVFVQTQSKVQGIAVPAASLMKNPSNQTIVWVKTAPEKFEPRVVSVEPLDGVNVAVTKGLEPGDRVATQGATLINQVR